MSCSGDPDFEIQGEIHSVCWEVGTDRRLWEKEQPPVGEHEKKREKALCPSRIPVEKSR
jgi:hypothetical protein